ncbi:MAG: hypothetical protein AB7E47_02380 [Desulfovibrionaceae bacterium]
MYNQDLKPHGEYLAKAQAVPQNASADGNGGGRRLAGNNGAVEIVGKVTTALALADTKSLSIDLHQAPDVDGEPGSYTFMASLYTLTASGAASVDVDTELFAFVLPTNCANNVKTVLTSTDVAATGAVDIYPRYLPR